MLTLFTLFIIKHFICDFPLQRWPYMYLNKGKYLHLGGILHAVIHGTATFWLLWFSIHDCMLALYAQIFDTVVHYHIDWAKVNLCKRFNLKPGNSEWYWHLLGLDQMLHYLTYVGIIWLVYV